MNKALMAIDDIERFLKEALDLRVHGEPGSHWPEHVWGELFAEALAGIEYLKKVAGAIDLLREVDDGEYGFIYDSWQEISECRECGAKAKEGQPLPDHEPQCLWTRVEHFLRTT